MGRGRKTHREGPNTPSATNTESIMSFPTEEERKGKREREKKGKEEVEGESRTTGGGGRRKRSLSLDRAWLQVASSIVGEEGN